MEGFWMDGVLGIILYVHGTACCACVYWCRGGGTGVGGGRVSNT